VRPATVDLRSDTVTRPTAAMRRAIADADVGDDALGDDPTVARLEAAVADLLGKEAALFFPSGIMANEAALAVLAPAGTEAITDATSHFVDWELGAAAALSGIQLRAVPTPDGLLTAELVDAAIRPALRLQIRTSVVSLENTHNAAGGRVHPLEGMRAVRDTAARHGLPVHLDGARLWNATAATGVAEAEYAACADTVMVTLSKGLGCPVGSVLAATSSLIDDARIARRRFGGAMRQAGILAAAGLYALEHHRARLVQDHERAATLARLCRAIDGIDVVEPETNIVMLDLERPGWTADAFVRAAAQHGVHLVEFTTRRLRAVTHLDVDDVGIRRAAEVIAAVAAALPIQPAR
jgi:threonine aldolase